MQPVSRRLVVFGATGVALLGVIARTAPADASGAVARRTAGNSASPVGRQAGRLTGGAADDSAAMPVLRSDFAAAVGQQFTARAESTPGSPMQFASRTHALTLVAIADLQPAVAAGDENRFALRFTASGTRPAEGIYRLTCAGVRDATLFIAPVGPANNRTTEAVVNRVA
ncbi:DUF6916 family protein [Rathayibacter soli]|uniref:DUF6916 family protein n=1 Tax=Rathayibacter soli TaxID=3144168 RepID=UPI0027E53BAF|nr:hypothetical protein [Glaciibacter superstes]